MDSVRKWIPYPLWIKKKKEEAEQKAKEEAEQAAEKPEEQQEPEASNEPLICCG
jgi:hypothetical protein